MVEAFKQTTALYGKKEARAMSGRVETMDLASFIDSVDLDKNKVLDFNEFVLLLADVFA